MKPHLELLKRLDACPSALERAEQYPDLQTAWDAWDRGDHMLWLIPRLIKLEQGDAHHRQLVLACCACGRLWLPYAADWQQALEAVYDDLERWAKGDDTVDLNAVTVRASHTAGSAIFAARSASDAANSAIYAVGSVSDAFLNQCAEIVRQHFPLCPAKMTE